MEKVIIKKLIEVGKLLYTEGLVDARAGNLSAKAGENLVITRRGSSLGRLQPWDFLKLNLWKDHPLEDRASSELIVHREVYRKTHFKSLLHAHPVATVLLSFKTDLIEPIDSEGKELLGKVKVIPGYPSGSRELAQAVAGALCSDRLVVVRGHGVFSADADPFYAYAHISILERSCKILLHERDNLQGL